MGIKVLYMGLFLKDPLFGLFENEIKDQHVTVQYMPLEGTRWPRELEGKIVSIDVTHYAISERVEAYGVELPALIKPFYKNPARPHITLSVAPGAKPVEAGKLQFTEYPGTDSFGGISLEAVVGYMTDRGIMINLP